MSAPEYTVTAPLVITSGRAPSTSSAMRLLVNGVELEGVESVKLGPARGDGAVRGGDIVIATIEVAVQLGEGP